MKTKLKRALLRRFMLDPQLRGDVVDGFHHHWYERQIENYSGDKHQYFGFPIEQSPLDLWLYQEIITQEKPAFILQTGIRYGGSMLYFAHLLDTMQAPESAIVIGIDVEMTESAKRLDHPRIRLLHGSSTDSAIVEQAKALMPSRYGFISLDSDHSQQHVAKELEIFADLCEPGKHMVIEDTNIFGHPVNMEHGPGPMEAVNDFLRIRPEFVQDNELWEKYLFSHHQGGWLRRKENEN